MNKSKQRDAIMEFLKDRKDHPSADFIYENVRKTNPKISLGTVYRNLQLLAEMGEIRKVNVGDGVDHFDPNPAEHIHFVCKECGGVSDLEIDLIQEDLQLLMPDFKGQLHGYVTYFYGICPHCTKEKNQ